VARGSRRLAVQEVLVENLTALLALIGIVIVVSALLSGAVERSGFPQVAVFLLLGAVLGPGGLDLLDVTLASPSLRMLATLSLMLVLFSDAISLDTGELRRRRRLALLVLGPGTLIPAALIAVAGWLLLNLDAASAAILGAALASTDPVLLRSLVRRHELPAAARLALRFESGMNDAILLPIIVLSLLFLNGSRGGMAGEIGRNLLGLFLLGPALGALVGLVGISILVYVRGRVGVRRDFESLYALGIAFGAYAAAEAVDGSGFLAAFTAGLMIAAQDVELCDCFLEYGEATSEMFLLLTFVAFGTSLIWRSVTALDLPTAAFAVIALSVRTVTLLPMLRRAGIDARSRQLVAWLGPRGLSTLLLVLLPVFAGVQGAERLFTIACLVVLLSVVIHGAGISIVLRRIARAAHARRVETEGGGGGAPGTVPAAPPSAATAGPEPAVVTPDSGEAPSDRITVTELRRLWNRGEPVTIVDARTERSYSRDNARARGAVRIPPEHAVETAKEIGLSQHATVVVYCA
jgi:NhaP-type Na+/H+ or K+/H+ antiporter